MKPFKRRKIALAALAAGLCAAGLSASAQDNSDYVRNTDASGRVCFRVDQVDGFAAAKLPDGTDGVNLRVRREVYQLKLASACPEVRDATRIALESSQPVMVCSGADVDIVAYSRIAPAVRCMAMGLRKVEPDEVAALPRKERP